MALAAFALAGCTCAPGGPSESGPGPGTAPSNSTPAAAPARTMLDFVQSLHACDVEHRGVLLDVGSDALLGRFGWASAVPGGLETVEHDGATWARVRIKKLKLSFYQPEPAPVFVSVRAIGRAARSIAVSLDEQPLGALALQRGQIRVASTTPTSLPLDPGLHTIALRFAVRGRIDDEPLAELDWVRVGVPDDDPSTFGAPTPRDIVAPAAALGGVPHRSLALRAPGAVRCSVYLPRTARLRTAVGVLGAGAGVAEIRVLRDGQRPVIVHRAEATGGDAAAWTDVDVPLAAHAGSLITVELRAAEGPRGGRVLFGDPAIVLASPPPPPVPEARAVIVVVLDGVEKQDLPPWGRTKPAARLEALTELVRTGSVFERHRAPTTMVGPSVASILTGLPPRGHGFADAVARLPEGRTTISAIARDASVRTAMFTGVPHTFRAFGLHRAWERFVEHAPSSGDPATAPLDGAAAWVAEVARERPDARMLVVVHARGGHPPWDVTPKELATLPPADYAGVLEPRRSAQILGKVRRARGPSGLTAADRERARALAATALAGQDRALGGLIAALRSAGLWDATLFIVTGDVASGLSDDALYAGGLDLREPHLALPLYVRFPEGLYAGRRIDAPTEVYDVARTALEALRLRPPARALGRDLAAIASGLEHPFGEPQVATLGNRYAARWGELVLSGRFDAAPTLCDLAVDRTCAFDRREAMPLAAQALFRRTIALDAAYRVPASQREPATIDADTAAQLLVWGEGD